MTGKWIVDKDRSADYNHSGFADLMITGLVGLRPRVDHMLEVDPLVPEGTWDYFRLDRVRYHGHWLTILYDRTGNRYQQGAGLRIFVDGRLLASGPGLARLTAAIAAEVMRAPRHLPRRQAAGRRRRKTRFWAASSAPASTCRCSRRKTFYRMWFSWRPRASVALVESKDGIHWSEPLIVLGPNDATDWEKDINRPIVIKKDNQYHMWYTGQARGHSWIGHATSADGKAWKRAGTKPVLSPQEKWENVAVMCPHVLWDEKAWKYPDVVLRRRAERAQCHRLRGERRRQRVGEIQR